VGNATARMASGQGDACVVKAPALSRIHRPCRALCGSCDQLSLVVALEAEKAHANVSPPSAEVLFDFGQGCGSVLVGLARTQEV